MRVSRWSILLCTFVLVVASCSDDDSAATTTDPTTTGAVPTSTSQPATATTAAPGTGTTKPTTTAEPTTTTTPAATTTTIAGEPFDIYPPKGAVLAVVGVAHDDVLNVRKDPGLSTVVTTLGPLADDIVSAGEGWRLPTTVWWKVVANGKTGWVNASYVAYLGATDDLTSLVVERYGGYPIAPTMAELGLIVAETLASADPSSAIVMTVPPTVGNLGEVTYDVIGFGDDSVVGQRIHVFGTPDGSGFSLKSVEATVLCDRGVSAGLCV